MVISYIYSLDILPLIQSSSLLCQYINDATECFITKQIAELAQRPERKCGKGLEGQNSSSMKSTEADTFKIGFESITLSQKKG
jgi:hypothetical protein